MIDIESHLADADRDAALRLDVLTGLTATPKWLPPKWFYDDVGSQLYEEITTLEEYYPFRAERAALKAHADDIAALTGAKTLIELGSGASDKTRLLLDALADRGALAGYVGFDVSGAALAQASERLQSEYPRLAIGGIVGDFTRHLRYLPPGGDRLIAFLGGTIGNLLPGARAAFLADVRLRLNPGEWLLLGADLVKDPSILVPAYDDARGVTARFNRNVLRVLNRRLGADFAGDAFMHVAAWDADNEWIEMRLRAMRPMRVTIPDPGLTVDFAAGEELRTEVSAKFRRDGITGELAAAGFAPRGWWTDPRGLFSLTLAQAV
ncbi:MAG TPA: L-histidine N(alpha)-methyltransferase [Stackebrandtia sp.]|jgi:L-histidine N-alpha-methyltransferase|uniref:L-histidine N(alpha)-methyltransferase n=1 Tax=Stackebrandtia sp. TaxID=2023065 RepID=UPI002D355FF9|nr:L-histidine N(alpha)-methyltransferase [Stackebrandtia sp.]HZE40972.1 L-histidine N(alpha)-methyltransferase [Stackebrandtia sp.]